MYNILITNDDGIRAEGIQRLVRSLSFQAKVYVAAPKRQQSGKSQSLTALEPFHAYSATMKGAEAAWEVDGTPADCVKFALQMLRRQDISVDFVFSGINMGANLGPDVHYSGTVGGAMEGAMSGIHSIALSVEHYNPVHYEYILGMIPELLDMAKETSPSVVLNVNTPDLPEWKIRGVRITRCSSKRSLVTLDEAEGEENLYAYHGEHEDLSGESDQMDAVAHTEGYATITPIRTDYTEASELSRLRRTASARRLCLFIDCQDKLIPVMRRSKQLTENLTKWAKCADALGLPIAVTQQYTRGLGPTIPEIRRAIAHYDKVEKFEKRTFTCFGAADFEERMDGLAEKSVILSGVETHICVYQTALDFRNRGFDVTILRDCCGSRRKEDSESALENLRRTGCEITTYETLVWQLLGTSEHPAFRKISEIIKS